MRDTSNTADYLDIRDIIERFEELENDKDLDEEDTEEREKLRALLEELKDHGSDHDWNGSWYPITLIRDSYFVDAMQELVQDIGDLPREIPCYLEIDWNATAENLRLDYSRIEYDGETYWYR